MNIEQFYPLFLKADKVTIDSRKIAKRDLFFAFSGENFNAATLAEKAIDDGALAAIVELPEFENKEKNIFYVPSTLEFLQQLAIHHRNQLSIPVIGLTGSNGKTTTKELIHAVLSEKFNVQYTYGNLNNHIGVPLTILSIKPEHEMAVIEMGANHQKEIELLCTIAQPDFGYITNFGKAHLEGFGGFEGVIRGKSELYDYLKNNSRVIVVNENDPIQVEKTENYPSTITFGKEGADYNYESFSEEHFVGMSYKGVKAVSKLTGEYNFTNLCAAASFGLHFGISFENIKHAVEQYTPTNMRSQVVKKDNRTLVLDTYNANPSSMAASLNNFISFEGRKTIIIGDMLELGDESEKEHQNILNMAQKLGFDQIITVGKHFKAVNPSGFSFDSTAELIEYLKQNKISSENILLKGSRGVALEKIIDFI
ncbi:UDP-N-acetylmuramoyl-tripeptide--D-alanyl-D-alanine ligase [Chryseobacterium indologenes]|uniref:UDP-N-acetylmuramoyl-tripeptide--D-alanyl-D- alanine ligase n=1 Tax=Chryseobacterium indologenes TaxID=253 RepID=UPI000F4EDF88|nr:UDP-N-acetylmuramoyl-tripeptide--D-alanyl-D-alanine ligase [Chryseobacterium indologenes]AYZ34896.1 UDP-N-acetylmuramoyl-tripeptide--D-alanyl-D-alanine ligase [Chryseobacterium indologenes]MBF6643506.1 UDP-N-acetylmuramoyl-tripeptide--D-alanyl-D-alanine ligase [Chryseobacterium indologenes]MBU3050233.1 UDP-N-acetylmuramoyl-tripeptide--D-alanyl-D-alanine ligase [Chryseobacterium indologenes]MEB4761539.1 UDP-N-acetylmuramoyl-tripeptide--D-alanyl-D-alanine ligase [Chryseobacterium indologenes]